MKYTTTQFELIPSLANKYEITKAGIVRNVKTKRILKSCHKCFVFLIGGRRICRSINSLLAEVYGMTKGVCNLRVPVILEQKNSQRYFDTIRAAAKFLSGKTKYTEETLRNFIGKQATIGDWHVRRLDKDDSTAMKRNNREAIMQRRIDRLHAKRTGEVIPC